MPVNDDSHDPAGSAEPLPSTPLRRAVLEVEAHVASSGWDQPPRLYALVRTAALVAAEPSLADQLAVPLRDDPDGFTTIEQDDLPTDVALEDVLDGVEWPDAVDGCAVVVERVMLPPEAEADLPDDPDALVDAVAQHPQRREVRLVAAVSRDGDRHSAVRARPRVVDAAPSDPAPSEAAPSEAAPSEAAPSEAAPSEAGQSDAAQPGPEQIDSELLEGPDLVPGLTDALRRTLEPSA